MGSSFHNDLIDITPDFLPSPSLAAFPTATTTPTPPPSSFITSKSFSSSSSSPLSSFNAQNPAPTRTPTPTIMIPTTTSTTSSCPSSIVTIATTSTSNTISSSSTDSSTTSSSSSSSGSGTDPRVLSRSFYTNYATICDELNNPTITSHLNLPAGVYSLDEPPRIVYIPDQPGSVSDEVSASVGFDELIFDPFGKGGLVSSPGGLGEAKGEGKECCKCGYGIMRRALGMGDWVCWECGHGGCEKGRGGPGCDGGDAGTMIKDEKEGGGGLGERREVGGMEEGGYKSREEEEI